MNPPNGTSAVVIGAGIAGLMTARVLSEHVDRVTVLERDRLDPEPVLRRGVPQGRHAHILQAAGHRLLEGWFPGFTEELTAAGAVPIDAQDMVWHQSGAYQRRSDLGIVAMSMSRPLLEHTLRARLLQQCANVSVVDDVSVDSPIVESGRVVGVRVDGVDHRADLTVGCAGRHTRFLDQLVPLGFPAPEISSIRIDMTYGSCLVTRRTADLDGTLAVVAENPARGHRIGMMAPTEGDRWIISICSFHDDMPPTEPDQYQEYARSLPSPVLADVLARAHPLTSVLTQRVPTAQRRRVEHLTRTPPGFLILGDAICSLNPVYAQGMSSAALQARELGHALERHGPTSPELARDFYRRAAKVIDIPWQLNAYADFTDSRTAGPAPVGTKLVNRYLGKVFRACHTSVPVARQVMRVHVLLARPTSLMTPAMIVRVLLAARRSPAAARGGANSSAGKQISA